METLDGTDWDVVISATGLPQSLLALALSRSGKKVLHLDRNDYYGGNEAALSLSEAEGWAEKHAGGGAGSAFSHASVTKSEPDDGEQKLGFSRAYSLALAPQLIYTRSNLLPALVSSRTHGQLEFQAVGSLFITGAPGPSPQQLIRVPSSREDIFQDDSLDLKAKRALVKFIRFVSAYEEQAEIWEDEKSAPFPAFLEKKFGLPASSHGPLLALTLTSQAPGLTTVEFALPRIARHLHSIGLFGPGFGAVLPKWGGLAEIAQVACRACAVGGGVYVLDKGIKSVKENGDGGKISVELTGGETVTTAWLFGCDEDLPSSQPTVTSTSDEVAITTRSISVVSSPLTALFPPTSEGGVTPAGAVIVVPSLEATEPPVHIFAHSSDSGECPAGQCVLYAAVSIQHATRFERLHHAIEVVLRDTGEEQQPKVLWRMQYQQSCPVLPRQITDHSRMLPLPSLSSDLALEDDVLEGVKAVWQKITEGDEETFMEFEARQGAGEDW